MSSNQIVIIGSGGFGREVLMVMRDIAARGDWVPNFVGFMGLEHPPKALLERLHADFVGSPDNDSALDRLPAGCQYIVGIGDGGIRGRYRARFGDRGMREATLIHPTAIVGEDVEIVSGVVCAGTIITTNVRLGRSTLINLNCTIGHDVMFGDDVTLAPGVNVAGAVKIGSRSTIYASATIIPRVSVGEDAVIGAGAVVIRDVPAGATVVGNPAREV